MIFLSVTVSGAIVYSRDNHIYIAVVGDWNPIELGRGRLNGLTVTVESGVVVLI